MNGRFRKVLRKTALYHRLRDFAVERAQRDALAEWERQGRPVPPPHVVKQQTLKRYATEYGLRTLVETGTCYGDMVRAMSREFDRIYSIELSDELFEAATRRFRRDPHVRLVQGDSAEEISRIVEGLDGPALFWLDGHYSGGETARGAKDTPVLEELTRILSRGERRDVIVIDDARLFGTDPAYPTLAEVESLVGTLRPGMSVEVETDSIRITPPKG